MESFDFDLKIIITGFKLSVIGKSGGLQEQVSTTGAFTQLQIDMLKALPTNGRAFFEEIKAKMPDGTTRPLNPINFKVN